MQKVTTVAQYLLALMLVIFGLNKFIGFMTFPPLDGFAADYMNVIGGSYILKTMGIIYLAGAVMLILNKAVGLAAVLLAPIAFNAFMFHLTLDPANIAGAAIFLVLTALVIIGNKDKFQGLVSSS